MNKTSKYCPPKTGVFAALMAESSTTITAADTYESIAGSFSNTPMYNFSLISGPAIQCDCNIKKYYEIDWHATIVGDSNGMTVHIGIKKNGTLVDSSVMCTYLKTADEAQ